MSISYTSESSFGYAGVLGISFNQDGRYFSVGLESGIRVYQTDPLLQSMRKGSFDAVPLFIMTT